MDEIQKRPRFQLVLDEVSIDDRIYIYIAKGFDVIKNDLFAKWSPKYSKELEVKEAIEIVSSASFLDIYLTCDTYNHLFTRLYDKRDDFNVAIINFPHLHSSILTAPAYGVYISQLIRYARACSFYSELLYNITVF